LSVKRAFIIIGVSGIALAIGGATIGYSLGRLSPTYYRSVFEFGRSPDFDPAQAGLGLGLTQGCIAGLIIGAVVVLAVSLSGPQQTVKGQLDSGDEVGRAPSRGCLRLVYVLLVGSVTTLPLGLGIGLIIGSFRGEYRCKGRRVAEEKAIITPVLAGDSAMAGITMEMFTGDGTAYLNGEVATQEDLDRLRSRMTTLLGEPRIKELMYGVGVRKN
jgi:hypothetical protein